MVRHDVPATYLAELTLADRRFLVHPQLIGACRHGLLPVSRAKTHSRVRLTTTGTNGNGSNPFPPDRPIPRSLQHRKSTHLCALPSSNSQYPLDCITGNRPPRAGRTAYLRLDVSPIGDKMPTPRC